MPSFTVKVPNNDDGEYLGEYESEYLPRVGDKFTLWHPRVNTGAPNRQSPFLGVVVEVCHEAFAPEGPGTTGEVNTTVWVGEEHAAPTLYCDCTAEDRQQWSVGEDGRCESCGHVRRPT